MLLITGANGQLGSELKAILPDAISTDANTLDIRDAESISSFVELNSIDTIINCAAYTAVDKAEDEPKIAKSINVDGAKNLAQSGAKIIHISTDYVFDGMAFKPYITEDATNPLSVYGKTKLEGEREILDIADTALIIRTSWLYSSYGNNFARTMHNLSRDRDILKVVSDQIGTPTYARDLALAIKSILPKIRIGEKQIYHYSNEGVASWYDFAFEILDYFHSKCKIEPIKTADYPTKATRPFYSVLDKSKIKEDFDIKIPHWKESLKRCLSLF